MHSNESSRDVTPSNRRYIDKELYEFLVSLMRESNTNYLSEPAELIRNEVVREQLRIFKSCIGKRK